MCMQFEFEELLLAWMSTVLEHSSFSLYCASRVIFVLEQNSFLETACKPSAIINEYKFIDNTKHIMQPAHE